MRTTLPQLSAALTLLLGVGAPGVLAQGGDDLPDFVTLKGTARDFMARQESGGHQDFQWRPQRADGKGAFGHYVDIVADELDDDGKPVFKSSGRRVTSQWKDGEGNNVMPWRSYIAKPEGGQAGSAESEGLAVHDARASRSGTAT
jgi:hypothetical protein